MRIRPHSAWLDLGLDDEARRAACRDLVRQGLSDDEANELALHTREQKS